jgi:peptidoglycan/xylan/chitin deacetylase (PgdA/CDA1 family)
VSAPGTFLLTFDTELLWGLFFHAGWRRRALERYGPIREVFGEILELLDRRDIRATFAFVGHLFLDRCERIDGRPHPGMPRPEHDRFRGDWYAFDPGTDLSRDPLWYGRDLVERVRAARPEHEIAAHGFSHAFLDGSRELARAEMEAAAAAAGALGLRVRSFVYPRNLVGSVEELEPAGYTHYRRGIRERGALLRAGGFLGRMAGLRPPVGRPRRVEGVVEVPVSRPMLPAMGLRRVISVRTRLREIRKGLRRARDERAVFHLYTHPHNFVEGRERMLEYLDRALALVAGFRERGEVAVRTMAELEPDASPGGKGSP